MIKQSMCCCSKNCFLVCWLCICHSFLLCLMRSFGWACQKLSFKNEMITWFQSRTFVFSMRNQDRACIWICLVACCDNWQKSQEFFPCQFTPKYWDPLAPHIHASPGHLTVFRKETLEQMTWTLFPGVPCTMVNKIVHKVAQIYYNIDSTQHIV